MWDSALPRPASGHRVPKFTRARPSSSFVFQIVAATDNYMGPMNQVRRRLAPTFRIPTAPVLLTVLALVGCSAAGGDAAGRGSAGSGSTGNVSPSTSGGASPSSNGNGSAGNSVNLNVDPGSTPVEDGGAGCA